MGKKPYIPPALLFEDIEEMDVLCAASPGDSTITGGGTTGQNGDEDEFPLETESWP